MRNRAAVILLDGEKVALIRREKMGSVYYVFPGGGIEEGETPEQAAKREALEELGVNVRVGPLVANVFYEGNQYFFHGEITDGIFGTGKGPEFIHPRVENGTYTPQWVPLYLLNSLDVRPHHVAGLLNQMLDG